MFHSGQIRLFIFSSLLKALNDFGQLLTAIDTQGFLVVHPKFTEMNVLLATVAVQQHLLFGLAMVSDILRPASLQGSHFDLNFDFEVEDKLKTEVEF